MDKIELSSNNICNISGHSPNILDLVCIAPTCIRDGPICSKCLQEKHLNHKDNCISLDDFKEKLKAATEHLKTTRFNRFHKSIYDSIVLIRKSLNSILNTFGDMQISIRNNYEKILQDLKNNNKIDIYSIATKFDKKSFKDLKDFQDSFLQIEQLFEISTNEEKILKKKSGINNAEYLRQAIMKFKENKEKMNEYFDKFAEKLAKKPKLQPFYFDDIQKNISKNLNQDQMEIEEEEMKIFNTDANNTNNFGEISNKEVILDYSGHTSVNDDTLINHLSSLVHSYATTIDWNYEMNNIGDQSMIMVSEVLTRFPLLTKLKLNFAGNRLTDKGIECLAIGIKNKKGLKEIDLNFSNYIEKNYIVNIDPRNLPEKLKYMKSCDDLSFRLYYNSNEITESGIIIICQALEELNELTSISLHFTGIGITDQSIFGINNMLKNKKDLNELSIILKGCTKLSSESIKSISEILTINNKLNKLNIELPYSFVSLRKEPNIFQNLQNLQNLKHLALSFAESTWNNEDLKMISPVIAKLTNLTYLSLNLLSTINNDDGLTSLGEAIGNLNELEALILKFNNKIIDRKRNGGNNITANGISALAIGLKKLKKLAIIDLDFSTNRINDKGVHNIMQSISDLSMLKEFSFALSDYKSESYGIEKIERGICNSIIDVLLKCKLLEKLSLSLCDYQICDDGLRDISRAIKDLNNLTYLHLNLSDDDSDYKNDFGIKGIVGLTEAISTKTNLIYLHLDFSRCGRRMGNKIRDGCAEPLCRAIGHLKKLTNLYINFRGHEITDNTMSTLFNSLKTLISLEKIYIDASNRLSDNMITDDSFNSLFEFLRDTDNPKLTSLVVNFSLNKLSDISACYMTDMLPYLYRFSTVILDFHLSNMTEDGKTSIQSLVSTLDRGFHMINI